MHLATALAPAYYRMYSTDVYCSKQTTAAAVAPKEAITHHFFVLRLSEENCRCSPKFVAAQKMLKQKPANIRKWLSV